MKTIQTAGQPEESATAQSHGAGRFGIAAAAVDRRFSENPARPAVRHRPADALGNRARRE